MNTDPTGSGSTSLLKTMLTLIRMIAAGSSDHDLLRAAADHGILHRRDQQVAQ